MSESREDPGAVSRRRFLRYSAAGLGLGAASGIAGSLFWAGNSRTFAAFVRRRERERLVDLADAVLPMEGYPTGVAFGDSIQKLTAAGVVSPAKFQQLYAERGGLPGWVAALFRGDEQEPIRLSRGTAPYLLNLLWPIGIANRTAFNEDSPLNGPRVDGFASTGGWTLGMAARGGGYFNRVVAVPLTAEQEAVVREAAEGTFRPCCDNSAFFQDCNHGSAMLGLYQLAASQGATLDELFAMALVANSYWYPDQYLETAVLFEQVEGTSWSNVEPRVVLSEQYSSLSGWNENVHARLSDAGLLQGGGGTGGGCSV
jgi:hypothetical protein